MINRKRLCVLCIMLVLMMTGCGLQSSEKQIEKEKVDGCKITFFDTGKSDSILIQMDDCVVLNDTADEDDYEKIQKALDEKGIDKIDYMIISHFDKDHIGSAAQLIENNEIGCVLMPSYWGDSDEYKDMMSAIQDKGVESRNLKGNYEFMAGETDIFVDVAHESSYKDENNYSLITTVTYGENSVLLMGDALKVRMEEFLEDVPAKENQYVLVKTPHHGDYYKKLKNFFKTTKPQYAIITDSDERERVEDKLLSLLEEIECNVLYTYHGDIVVNLDASGMHVEQ